MALRILKKWVLVGFSLGMMRGESKALSVSPFPVSPWNTSAVPQPQCPHLLEEASASFSPRLRLLPQPISSQVPCSPRLQLPVRDLKAMHSQAFTSCANILHLPPAQMSWSLASLALSGPVLGLLSVPAGSYPESHWLLPMPLMPAGGLLCLAKPPRAPRTPHSLTPIHLLQRRSCPSLW